jgi:hypothetical protein
MQRGLDMRERGQVLPLIIVFMLVLLVMLGLVIDVAQAYRARVALRASTDAAALAGAASLPNTASASSTAYAYGGGGKNPVPNVGAVATNVQTSCTSNFPGCRPANTVSVTQSADVNTTFLRLLGVDKIHIQATASACSPCGAQPLDVMLVLDRTGSMCQFSDGRNDPSCTDLNNAKDGIRTFLQLMDPSGTKIGLAVLPPATSVGNRCAAPASGNYNAPGNPYVVVPLVNDYRSPGGALNPSSQLVSTVNCIRGAGSTAYANAIEAAQAELDRSGRPEAPDIIVMLSDGAANTGPSYLPNSSLYRTQPCNQGVRSAGTIKGRKTMVYTIGYDLDATAPATNICKNGVSGATESPAITAYSALQQMASPGNFYNHPTPTDLSAIFQAIAFDINEGKSRLFD